MVLAVLLLFCFVFSSCQNDSYNKDDDEFQNEENIKYTELSRDYVNEYIYKKYGFYPQILSAERVQKPDTLFPNISYTSIVKTVCSDGKRDFSVLSDISDNDNYSDNVSCLDNYQTQEIQNGFRGWLKTQTEGMKEIRIYGDSGYFYSYYADYYDGANLFDFMNEKSFDIYVYYTNHDFSDKKQFEFLEQLDDADIKYQFMFISCYSDSDIDRIKNITFPNQYEAVRYAPYIQQYAEIFRNSCVKEELKIHKLNIYDFGDLKISVLDNAGLYCSEKMHHNIDVEETDPFDDKRQSVSKCWDVTFDKAVLRFYIPRDKINYELDNKDIINDDHTYKLRGEFAYMGNYGKYTSPRTTVGRIDNSSYVEFCGDYVVFDLSESILSGSNASGKICYKIGVYEGI